MTLLSLGKNPSLTLVTLLPLNSTLSDINTGVGVSFHSGLPGTLFSIPSPLF